jgi:hypothetical protein
MLTRPHICVNGGSIRHMRLSADGASSRLGCQVKLTKELDGMVATLPAATRNMYVDGECPSCKCSGSGHDMVLIRAGAKARTH